MIGIRQRFVSLNSRHVVNGLDAELRVLFVFSINENGKFASRVDILLNQMRKKDNFQAENKSNVFVFRTQSEVIFLCQCLGGGSRL